jgi:hypothetical protein
MAAAEQEYKREKKDHRPRVTESFFEEFTTRGWLSIVFHPSSF